jgi:tetratricopeptide (TPR) repeat protein
MDSNDYQKSAMDHCKAGDYDAAIADMSKAIELTPNDAFIYALRGDMYSHKKAYDSAIDNFTKSIQISPNTSAYYGRGLAYSNKGDWEKAVQEYTKSIQLNPEDSYVHLNYYNRGISYFKCNRREEALADIEKAVQLVPDDDDYQRGLEMVKRAGQGGGDAEIAAIQREIKILLICSGVCAVIGIIIGIIACGGYYGDGSLGANIFFGIWIGAGIGALLEYIRVLPAVFKAAKREEGSEGVKSTFSSLLIWIVIFVFGGPFGLLVKVLMKKREISKIKKGTKNK